jgi:hypothetical protein
MSAKAEEDKALTEVIKTSFNEGRECYGTRRIQQDLIDQELTVSRRRSTMLSNPGVLHTISCAKYAAAFFKISRSWVNLRTCFFNRFISLRLSCST